MICAIFVNLRLRRVLESDSTKCIMTQQFSSRKTLCGWIKASIIAML